MNSPEAVHCGCVYVQAIPALPSTTPQGSSGTLSPTSTFQAEWRWTPSPSGLDMAIFCDAGKVTAARSDLDLNRLRSDVGIGIRFHSVAATPLRVEIAKGNEGFVLVFAGSAAF